MFNDTFLYKVKVTQFKIDNLNNDIGDTIAYINITKQVQNIGKEKISENDKRVKPCTGRALAEVVLAIGILLTCKNLTPEVSSVFGFLYGCAGFNMLKRHAINKDSKWITKNIDNQDKVISNLQKELDDMLKQLDTLKSKKENIFNEYYAKAKSLPAETRTLAKLQLDRFKTLSYQNLKLNEDDYIDYFNEEQLKGELPKIPTAPTEFQLE